MKAKYEAILHHPHHVSVRHKAISESDRAAQFSSFKALNGFEDGIDESARLTTMRKERNEAQAAALDEWMRQIRDGCELTLSITYFLADTKKSGGAYAMCSGQVRRINDELRELVMTDGMRIPLDDIYEIKETTKEI